MRTRQRNQVLDRLTLLSPKSALPPACDRLVANILLNPLIELAERIAGTVKSGGAAAFSGMLKGQEIDFIARYREHFDGFEVTQREDWIRITAVRC